MGSDSLTGYAVETTAGTFQSTLPYGERRWGDGLVTDVCLVSIHAPVWGATQKHVPHFMRQNVSIHAPVWGATKIATVLWIGEQFQSTLPYGERQRVTVLYLIISKFQSTLPYGERQRWGTR